MQNMFLWVLININLCIKNIKKHLAKPREAQMFRRSNST